MFSKQKLSRTALRKKAIIARSDLLRKECAQIQSLVGRRVQRVEKKLSNRIGIHPAVTMIGTTALQILKSRYLPRKPYLAPLFSLAGAALDFTRRPAPRVEIFTRPSAPREDVPVELYEMHGS